MEIIAYIALIVKFFITETLQLYICTFCKFHDMIEKTKKNGGLK